jgi:hypothetical protein
VSLSRPHSCHLKDNGPLKFEWHYLITFPFNERLHLEQTTYMV